jgi:hypothetical protein
MRRGNRMQAVAVTIFVLACAEATFAQAGPRMNTETRLRTIYAHIRLFKEKNGRYPVRLRELCQDGLSICEDKNRPLTGERDGWGRQLAYVPLDQGFELRSHGADGLEGTTDDLVLNSAVDGRKARALSGCFRAVAGWWPGRSPLIRLDTVLGSIGSFAVDYQLRLDAPGYRGVGEWYPVGSDSLVVSWTAGNAQPSIRLKVEEDTLVGRPDPWQGAKDSVLIVRTNCPVGQP